MIYTITTKILLTQKTTIKHIYSIAPYLTHLTYLNIAGTARLHIGTEWEAMHFDISLRYIREVYTYDRP